MDLFKNVLQSVLPKKERWDEFGGCDQNRVWMRGQNGIRTRYYPNVRIICRVKMNIDPFEIVPQVSYPKRKTWIDFVGYDWDHSGIRDTKGSLRLWSNI